MKPCNVVNCILRIKCTLNLLVSYVCFDFCGGIERAQSRGYRVRMRFPQTFWENVNNTREINPGPCDFIYKRFLSTISFHSRLS